MLQAHAQLNRGLLLVSVSTNGLDPTVKQELASIADMVLSFQVRTIGTDFETSMIVSKFRNAPENLKILPVTPEEGITPETVERIAEQLSAVLEEPTN